MDKFQNRFQNLKKKYIQKDNIKKNREQEKKNIQKKIEIANKIKQLNNAFINCKNYDYSDIKSILEKIKELID